MARGGRRNGKPGASYSQRTDLQGSAQAIKAAPGQAYGAAQEQREMQQAVPIAGTAVPPQAPGGAGGGGEAAPAPSGPTPGMGFAEPTGRPDEPITAGMPMGAGGGPEMLGMQDGQQDELRDRLAAMYQMMPTEEIRQMIEMLDEEAGL